MNSAAEWVASIPAELTPREALVYVETALRDAREATDEIRARYSGTVPPPPWPQHDELRAAIDGLDGGRLLLTKAIELGHGDTKFSKGHPNGLRLQNAGKALYREIAIMQNNLRGVKVEDVPQLLKNAAASKVGGWLTFVAVVWMLHQLDDVW